MGSWLTALAVARFLEKRVPRTLYPALADRFENDQRSPGRARRMRSDSICAAAAGKRRDAERGGDAVNGSVEQR